MAHPNARQTQFQLSHYFRKTVNWNDTGIATGVYVGTFPAGAMITSVTAYVGTAFNAGTTNVLTLGTLATGTELANNAATVPGTPGYKSITPNASPYTPTTLTVDTDFYAFYTQTGTAATAGQATFVVHYAPNNDQ